MPGSKFGSLKSHNLKKQNMIPRGNKFVRRHDLTALLRLYIHGTHGQNDGHMGENNRTVTTVYNFPHVRLHAGEYVTRNKFNRFRG